MNCSLQTDSPAQAKKMKSTRLQFLVFFLLSSITTSVLSHATADHDGLRTSIVFATYGRSRYAFDIYALPALDPPTNANLLRITDGHSVNFNGQFLSPSSSSSVLSLLSNQTLTTPTDRSPHHLVYISERNGSPSIYFDAIYYDAPGYTRKRSALQLPRRIQFPLLRTQQSSTGRVSMKDRPSLVGEHLIYVSTHEDSGVPRTSWAAVYSTHLKTGLTRRLTPYGMADFSPSVSPSGVLTAVASFGERGWGGEVDELNTDIYLFMTRDGSKRVKVVEHGGWPSWADDSTLYFHRRSDGWWSVYRAILPEKGPITVDSVKIQRVTTPGFHAFTPAASPANKSFIALATRRPDSDFRHIEILDVVHNQFRELTRPISPHFHHFNPFISPDSSRVGYHRCRGNINGKETDGYVLLENIQSPTSELSLFRIDGTFPSFSPDGERIAFVSLSALHIDSPGLYVVNRDGSNLRKVFHRYAFATAWDPRRKGVVYTSAGPSFAEESAKVDIIAVNVDDEELSYMTLTIGGDNNAFPSPSPDGKFVVFRSGRSGHKNLYIMDAVDGERGGIHRLTEGPWTDTMCDWSPDGDWIAFASDRDNPGAGGFELYLIHPNGTGLRKLIQSGSGGRTNHPWFSPDGKSIAFTSDYAGVSAEPISNPHHYQPYGDIFTIRLDGTGIRRLTHNSYEDGTPTWAPTYLKPVDVQRANDEPQCTFEDCHWLATTDADDGVESAFPYPTNVQCGQ